MAKLSQLTIPVKNPSTGTVTPQTFDLAGSGGGGSDTNYIGTKTDYDALPSSEQNKYNSMDFTDYHDGLNIDPTPMINSKNPVASGGVYAALQNVNSGIENLEEGVTNATELVAPLEQTLVATRSYSVGDQFVYNGFLYKVTAAIPFDSAIVIGTNCVLSSDVVNQLRTITSQITTLQNQIDTLSADTGWVTISNNLRYRKKGNTVSVIVLTLKVSSWTSVGTLPAGTLPPVNLFLTGFANESTAVTNAYIRTDGAVYVYGTNVSLYECFTYLV